MRAFGAVLVAVSVLASVLVSACGDAEPTIAPEMVPPPAPRLVPDRSEAEHGLGIQVPQEEIAPELKVECEPGERRMCRGQIAVGPHPGPHTLWQTCRQWSDGMFHFSTAGCGTPLVVSFDEAPVAFTRPAGAFTIGSFARTEWVAAKTPWLALDRDGSGCIEREDELFGPPTTGGSNGFDKLAQLDDDHDGLIDARDAAYAELVLWSDRDQDRRCVPGELQTLSEAGVIAIELAYATPAIDGSGSYEGETAALWVRGPEGPVRRGRVVDVYLASLD